MPTTPAARELIDRPADALQHVAGRLTLAHHIARVAPTCKVVSVAARNAIIARAFSPEVVTLAGHAGSGVACVAAAPDGRVVIGSDDGTIKVWRDGACERTIETTTIDGIMAVAVLQAR